MSRHIAESDLTLYASGDVGFPRSLTMRLHVGSCERCSRRVSAYRADKSALRDTVAEMPAGLDWESMAREMSANIHLGLAAGECVAPKRAEPQRRGWQAGFWMPATIAVAATGILALAWTLNVPPQDNEAIARAVRSIFVKGERGTTLSVSASGVELRENGRTINLGYDTRVKTASLTPVAYSMDVAGSASARYVDSDSDQVTIASVYVE